MLNELGLSCNNFQRKLRRCAQFVMRQCDAFSAFLNRFKRKGPGKTGASVLVAMQTRI